MRYYTSRIQMHKTRPLCGSIAVTIATHKNSKIQRLSEFFLMRISAYFATFAILSYIKIIDNSWHLSHLLSYFLLGIQWGKNTLTSNGQQFTFPLTSSSGCFVMFASDRDYGCDRLGIVPNSENTFVCWNKGDAGQFTQSDFSWIAICI